MSCRAFVKKCVQMQNNRCYWTREREGEGVELQLQRNYWILLCSQWNCPCCSIVTACRCNPLLSHAFPVHMVGYRRCGLSKGTRVCEVDSVVKQSCSIDYYCTWAWGVAFRMFQCSLSHSPNCHEPLDTWWPCEGTFVISYVFETYLT